MAGNPGIPAIRRDGGVRKSTQKEREVKRKESKRKMEEVVVVGDLEKDLGTPSPHSAGPGPARSGRAARAIQRPGALLSLGRGW